MLVYFRFKNFGPFKNETEFDMRAIKSYKEHTYNLATESDGSEYLKVASIYGANASGKSSFIDAYRYFRAIVRDSFSFGEKNESTLEKYYFPFLFDAESDKTETEFEGLYHDDVYEYKYGFSYDDTAIHYEWLYRRSIETKRQVLIFERSSDNINLGAPVKKSCEKYIADIEPDVLALSFFSRLKLRTPVFKDAARCIMRILPLRTASEEETEKMLSLYFSDTFDKEGEREDLLTFLDAVDVGIKDIEVKKNEENVRVYTHHEGKDGNTYVVPFNIESDGTKRAIALYSFVKIAIAANQGLIVDELDAQLHPLLMKYMVDLFYEHETKGQLIYTTHDTTLLDKRYVRRDQVWFTEKDKAGEATLYSLAEFKVRNDQSFEKGYLGGIFGGIPKLKDISAKE